MCRAGCVRAMSIQLCGGGTSSFGFEQFALGHELPGTVRGNHGTFSHGKDLGKDVYRRKDKLTLGKHTPQL